MTQVKLRNAYVEFEFDAYTGSLLQIQDLVAKKPMLHDPERARMFRIMCPNHKWYSRYADSQDSKVTHMQRIDLEHAQQIIFHYDHLSTQDGEAPIAVNLFVTLPHDSAEARFQLEVTNHSAIRLQEIRFPWVGGWKGFDGPEIDRAYAGIVPVTLYPDVPETYTHNIGGSRKRKFIKYTVGMQLPFFDVSGEKGGLSYICYQEKPKLGGLLIENLDREPNHMSMSWAWVHYPFVKPHQSWTSPIIGIGVHQGNWQQTADRFRTWANSWWKPPVSPTRLYEILGMQTVQIRGLDGKPLFRYEDIPQIAKDGLACGIEDLSIWDVNSQVYMRPDDGDIWDVIDETQPLAELKKQVELTKSLGVHINTMVNVRLLREKSTLYQQIGEQMVMRNVSGTPTTEDASHYSYHHAELLSNYLSHDGRALCQKTLEFQQRALAITRTTKELGFTSHFIDQPFDYQLCLSDEHNHELPDDTHEAALEWVVEAIRYFKEHDPESYIIGELSEVFAMQHIDISWIWEMSVLAPEIMRYTFPEALIFIIVDRQPEILNRAFALGALVAFTTCELEKTLASYPEFGKRVSELVTLRKITADFTTKATFRYIHGLQAPIEIRAYIFEATHGLGVIVADETNQTRHIELTIDLHQYPQLIHTDLIMTLFTQQGTSQQAGTRQSAHQLYISFTLSAMEVATWTIEQVK